MVERISKPMEPSEPSSSSQPDKDNIRCLTLGLESSLQRCNHGQHLSNFLPQSQGRDNISISQLPCLGDLAMVHVSEHLTSSQLPSRSPQPSSRYRVQDDKGQMGFNILFHKWEC